MHKLCRELVAKQQSDRFTDKHNYIFILAPPQETLAPCVLGVEGGSATIRCSVSTLRKSLTQARQAAL